MNMIIDDYKFGLILEGINDKDIMDVLEAKSGVRPDKIYYRNIIIDGVKMETVSDGSHEGERLFVINHDIYEFMNWVN